LMIPKTTTAIPAVDVNDNNNNH